MKYQRILAVLVASLITLAMVADTQAKGRHSSSKSFGKSSRSSSSNSYGGKSSNNSFSGRMKANSHFKGGFGKTKKQFNSSKQMFSQGISKGGNKTMPFQPRLERVYHTSKTRAMATIGAAASRAGPTRSVSQFLELSAMRDKPVGFKASLSADLLEPTELPILQWFGSFVSRIRKRRE